MQKIKPYQSEAFEVALSKGRRIKWTRVDDVPEKLGLYEVARMDIGRIEFMLWNGEVWDISLHHPFRDEYSAKEWPEFIDWAFANNAIGSNRDWAKSFWRGLTEEPVQDKPSIDMLGAFDSPPEGSFIALGASIYDTPRAKLLVEKVVFGDGDVTVRDLRKALGIAEPNFLDKDNVMRFF